MKSINLSAFLAVVSTLQLGCVQGDESNSATMDLIEASIDLPSGVQELEEYTRYYASDNSGVVLGFYALPLDGEVFLSNCEVSGIEVSKEDCDLYGYPTLKPGQRVWLDSEKRLPGVNDGGCSIITFRFKLDANRFENLACNGEA